MTHDTVMTAIFLIFSGAAALGTLALFTRQSLLVAYIVLGIILGPWLFQYIGNRVLVTEIGDIGIIFLLFLLGLHLQPKSLFALFRKTLMLTVVSSIIFALIGYGVARCFHYTNIESIVIGASMMFSSTIIGLKLLPTTILHHKHTGEVMISILLLQDVIAIIVLIILQGLKSNGHMNWLAILIIMITLPSAFFLSQLIVRHWLIKIIKRFDTITEFVWIISIGWCMFMVEVGHYTHLSEEVGAFIAGVALAEHPIAEYIAETLKPLRDLFLVMFFFSVGAHFELDFLPRVFIPATILAACALLIKPVVYKLLLHREGEPHAISWEIGIRLAQISEFSLLVAYLAANSTLIGDKTSFLIQATAIFTFIVSSYWVVLRYPTPLATSSRLRQH
jgi:Kef-type K+ transport system membrane component KefB